MAGMSTPQPCGTRENDFFVVTTHLLNDFQTFPVNTLLDFFGPRIANSAIIAIAAMALAENISSTIASRSASLRYGKAQRQLISARRRELFPSRPAKRFSVASKRVAE